MVSQSLQNEKRQLETAMVVESRMQMKAKGLSKHSVEGTDGSFVVSEVGDVLYPDHDLSAFPPLRLYSLSCQCLMLLVLAWSQAAG